MGQVTIYVEDEALNAAKLAAERTQEIGRASCRERV